MDDIDALVILLESAGLTNLGRILKNAIGELEQTTQYGSIINSTLSHFNIYVPAETYFDAESLLKESYDKALECVKKIYPDRENAPEVVDIILMVLKQGKIKAGDDKANPKILSSIRDLIKRMPEADSYVVEASMCYQNLLLRSSVNMTWQLFVFALFKRIQEFDLTKFVQLAKSKNMIKCNITVFHDLNKFKESDLIQLSHECGFYDQNVRNDLNSYSQLRNSCSHVSFNAISRQKVESFLTDVVSYTEELLSPNRDQVGSTPDDDFLRLSELESSELNIAYSKLNPQQEKELLKQCFYYLSKENALGELGIIKSEKLLKYAVTSGNASVKVQKIKMMLSQAVNFNFYPEFLKRILPVFFKNPTYEKLLGNDPEFRANIVDLYCNSTSFDETKRRADLPFYILGYLTQEEKTKLGEAITDNSQINGCFSGRWRELLGKINYTMVAPDDGSIEIDTINIDDIPF